MEAFREGAELLKRRPWLWLALGGMAWLSRMGPPILTWWSAQSPPEGPLGLDSTASVRSVMTASYWASLLGLWRLALESASDRPLRIGAYLEGFFGGFLILMPAVIIESASASAPDVREAAWGRLILLPFAGFGSFGLALIAARVSVKGWAMRIRRLASPLGCAWLAWESAAMAASLFGFLFAFGLPDVILSPLRLAIGAVVLRRLTGRR
jgi:hypothetical protein